MIDDLSKQPPQLNPPEPNPDKGQVFHAEQKVQSTKDFEAEKKDVRRRLDQINIARKYRDRILDDMGVQRFVKEYGGEYDVRLGNVVVPPINEVWAYVQTLISVIYAKDPYIAVNAQKNGTIKGAALLETAVNYYQRVLRSKEEYELEIMDTILAGHAWHKTGISVKTVDVSGDRKIASEKFYSNRLSYRDVVFNIGSIRPPYDCQWIAQRIVKPTEEVKDVYKERAAGLRGGPHPALNKEEIKATMFKGDIEFSTLWELHDVRTREVMLLAEGHDRYLREKVSWPDYIHEFPFRMLWWNANPDNPYPYPDIKAIEPQILEEIKFLGMAINHLKRFARQLAAKKGAIDDKEMDKLEKGIDGSIINVKTNGNPAEALVPIQYAPLPPEIFTVLNILDGIKTRISGQPNTDQGAPQRTFSRTEDELIMIQKGSKGRTDRKLNRLEDHMEAVSKDLIAHMQGNFDIEQIIKITGETPQSVIEAFGDKYDRQTQSIKFTKDDIQGEYDVDVQGGSTLPLDKETRMQLLSIVLDKTSRLATLGSLPPFMKVVIQELLKDYDIKALEAAFKEQDQQAAQQQQAAAQDKQIDQDKTKAETQKRLAQATELKAQTVMETGRALHEAHQAGILPEAIELGRGLGVLPDAKDDQPAAAPPAFAPAPGQGNGNAPPLQ
jgi:hypothetical protein